MSTADKPRPVEGIVGREDDRYCQATPRHELMARLLNSNIAKSELEWAAAREIENLRNWIRK